tara:strand:+ start:967 stop:1641 length:675 start_codon:yes stop_codon:yes gene_type:complete
MNQFKDAWQFLFNNWKYFLVLALPLIAIESTVGYLLIPLGDMTQPEDFMNFFQSNSLVIGLVSITGVVLQMAFIGGLYLSYMAIDSNKEINPINALQAGLAKFFPLFGTFIIVTIVSAFGYLLLILPGVYLTARLALFPFYIMLENQKIFQSISSSWENTDEHGSKLFVFTLIFVVLTLMVALILSSVIPQGFFQTALLALSEYIFVVPLGYIYFTLYKSLKIN